MSSSYKIDWMCPDCEYWNIWEDIPADKFRKYDNLTNIVTCDKCNQSHAVTFTKSETEDNRMLLSLTRDTYD